MEKKILKSYEKNLAKTLRENSVNSYIRDIDNMYMYIEEKYPERNSEKKILSETTYFDIEEMFEEKKYKASTYNRKILAFNCYYDWLVTVGIIEKNFMKAFKMIRKEQVQEETQEKNIFSFDDFKKILVEAKPMDRAVFSLMYISGARISEVLSIKFEDIEECDGYKKITIDKSRVKNKIEKKIYVPNNTMVERYFNCWLAMRKKIKTTDDEYLFIGRNGKNLLGRSKDFNDKLNTITKRLNMRKISNHCFRHSCVIRCEELGTPNDTIRKFIGWQEPSVLGKVYSNHNTESKEKIMVDLARKIVTD